jgi:hypothetical protein
VEDSDGGLPSPGDPNRGRASGWQSGWAWVGKGAVVLGAIYYAIQLYTGLFADRPELVANCYFMSGPLSPPKKGPSELVPNIPGGTFKGVFWLLEPGLRVCKIQNVGNQPADDVKLVLSEIPKQVWVSGSNLFSIPEEAPASKSIQLGALGVAESRDVRLWSVGANTSINLFHRGGAGKVYEGRILYGWVTSFISSVQQYWGQFLGTVFAALLVALAASLWMRRRRE